MQCEEERAPSRKKKESVKAGRCAKATLALLAAESAPTAAFLLAFSGLGYGEEAFRALRQHLRAARALALSALGYLALLHVLDGFRGLLSDVLGKLRLGGVLLAVLALAASALLSVDAYPSAPAAVFLGLSCAAAALVRFRMPRLSIPEFLSGLCASSFALALLVFAAWFWWVTFLDNNWNERRQAMYEERANCEQSAHARGSQRCRAAYLMWAWPAIISALHAIVACTSLYLAVAIVRYQFHQDALHPAARLLFAMAALGVSGVWISVSLSTVQMDISEIIMQIVLLIVGLVSIISCAAISLGAFVTEAEKKIPLFRKVKEIASSDWAKGFLVVAGAPILVIHLVFSMLKQAVRRVFFTQCCPARLIEEEQSEEAQTEEMQDQLNVELERKLNCLTISVRRQVSLLFFSPTSMLSKASLLGLAYWLFQVGTGKIVVLFLSWLTDALDNSSVATIFLTFLAVGIGLFVLLPPVPGAPIYIAAGIVVTSGLESNGFDFWSAIAVAIGFTLFIKLLACAMQQKLIGEVIGQKVSVRRAVGINSKTMRAIWIIVNQRGLQVSKVAVLCGGPDWPVGVLCGILRVPLVSVLVGSVPVLFLYLGVSVIAGGLQLKVDEGKLFRALASLALALAALSMATTMFAAVYFVEKVSAESEEIDKLPYDEEVRTLEQDIELKDRIFEKETQWQRLPVLARSAVVLSLICTIISVHSVVWFNEQSFKSFNITDSVRSYQHYTQFLMGQPLTALELECANAD
jgi:hypothetical protein